MGCSTSNDVVPKDYSADNENQDNKTIPRSPNLKKDYPIAFEVPFHDIETVVKKPLPPKLQRLQEQSIPEPEETMKSLQKRLADADERRQQILSMRVSSAQQFHLKGRSEKLLESPKEEKNIES